MAFLPLTFLTQIIGEVWGELMDISVKEIVGSCEVNIIDLCLPTLFAKVAI